MVQIIKENRKPTFLEDLAPGIQRAMQTANEYLQRRNQMQQLQQENEALKQQYGIDLSGISDPNQRKALIADMLSGRRNQQSAIEKFGFQKELEEIKSKNKREIENLKTGRKAKENEEKFIKEKSEKIEPLKSALDRVQKMKSIRAKNNLGRGSSIYGAFGGETAKDIGAYETLGNSLIQYATNIPIRNRTEFEQLAGKISDPYITNAEAEGILNELEGIINDSLKAYQVSEDSSETPQITGIGKGKPKERPPLSSFHR